MIEVKGISKSYNSNKVLDNVSCKFEDGRIYCLMGESGVGKTTLLRIIMGLEKPDAGSVTDGLDIAAVFQEDRLIMERSAVDNVLFVRSGHDKQSERENIRNAMIDILPEECLDRCAAQLSGGMKRRAALARAVLSDRQVLILDEPFTGLDDDTRQKAIEFILNHQGGRTVILATHDQRDAKMLNAGICLLTMGRAIDTII